MKIILFFLLISSVTYAQEASISYELKINRVESTYPIHYLLLFKDGKSIQIPMKNNSTRDTIMGENSEVQIRIFKSGETPFLFKD